MRRNTIFAAVASLSLLAACDTSTEASPPPVPQDALTTATAEPPDTEDAAATSEVAVVTEEPEAEGPPEMPEEAMEQTEKGAEAFVAFYFETLNFTGLRPEVGLLEPLSTDNCGTCAQFEAAVIDLDTENERYDSALAEVGGLVGVHMDDSAIVTATVDQLDVNVVTEDDRAVDNFPAEQGVRMEFQLQWLDDHWTTDKILLVEQRR